MFRSTRSVTAAFGAGFSFVSTRAFCNAGEDLKAFSPKEFRKFQISEVKKISPNTNLYKVSLPSEKHEMGVSTASCIMIKGADSADGKVVARPYTPSSLNSDKGSFELIIKTYPQGVVSSYLHTLKAGDSIEVKGPFPKIAYTPNMKKEIGMIAGGTGITPMLQIIKEVLNNPNDKTKVHLVFANNSVDDILCKEELDSLVKKHSNFKVTYVISQPSTSSSSSSPSWKGYHTGFVSQDIISQTMPKPSSDVMVMVCGPPPMMVAVSGNKTPDYKQGPVEGMLKVAGFTEDMVYKF